MCSFRICYAYIIVDEMVVDSGIVFSDYFHERIHVLFADETFQIGLDFIWLLFHSYSYTDK